MNNGNIQEVRPLTRGLIKKLAYITCGSPLIKQRGGRKRGALY